MVEQESAVTLGVDGLPVVHRDERRVGAQTLGGLPGQPGAGGRIGAFDADQDQPRSQAVPQLVHEQLLLGRGCARQECRQVGGEVGAAYDEGASQQEGQP